MIWKMVKNRELGAYRVRVSLGEGMERISLASAFDRGFECIQEHPRDTKRYQERAAEDVRINWMSEL
jgi:hypothetical protein